MQSDYLQHGPLRSASPRRWRVWRVAAALAAILCCSLMFGGGTALASTYQVQAGDSLYAIADKHKITVEALKAANNLQSEKILVGQILQLPMDCITHIVRAGETLYQLARQYDCTVKEIRALNNISGDVIAVGAELKIPGEQNVNRAAATVSSSRSGGYRTYTQSDWDTLAQVVYGEARGESYDGQVAVAAVVLNRLESSDFPDTVHDVVFQKNAFTCVSDGQFYLSPNRTAYQAALEAMQGADPTDGCLYYWNPATATSRWIWTREVSTQIGNHVFGV